MARRSSVQVGADSVVAVVVVVVGDGGGDVAAAAFALVDGVA